MQLQLLWSSSVFEITADSNDSLFNKMLHVQSAGFWMHG